MEQCASALHLLGPVLQRRNLQVAQLGHLLKGLQKDMAFSDVTVCSSKPIHCVQQPWSLSSQLPKPHVGLCS